MNFITEVRERETNKTTSMHFDDLPVGPFIHVGVGYYAKDAQGGAWSYDQNYYYTPEVVNNYLKDEYGPFRDCRPIGDDEEFVVYKK